jgi:transcriptional regulator with XRE-family HTH domain
MDLIKKIKLAMLDANLNQTGLAKKMGITKNAVNSWFRGKRNPTSTTLNKMAKATNKPLSYFFEDYDSDTIVNTGKNSVVGKNQSVVNREALNNIELMKKEVELMKKENENLKLKLDLILEKSKRRK